MNLLAHLNHLRILNSWISLSLMKRKSKLLSENHEKTLFVEEFWRNSFEETLRCIAKDLSISRHRFHKKKPTRAEESWGESKEAEDPGRLQQLAIVWSYERSKRILLVYHCKWNPARILSWISLETVRRRIFGRKLCKGQRLSPSLGIPENLESLTNYQPTISHLICVKTYDLRTVTNSGSFWCLWMWFFGRYAWLRNPRIVKFKLEAMT